MSPFLPLEPGPRPTPFHDPGWAGPPAPVATPELTLGEFTAMLRRRRWTMVICILLAVALVAAYTWYARPVFEATSVLRFEQEQVNLPQLVQQLTNENRISTEIELLQGHAAAQPVIDSLGLRARLVVPRKGQVTRLFSLIRVDPAADTGTITLLADGDSGFYARGGDTTVAATRVKIGQAARLGGLTFVPAPGARGTPEIRLQVLSPETAARAFESALKVTRPARDADLISVRVRGGDPALAAATANLLTQQVITGRQAIARARTASTVRFLEKQLDTLGTQLHNAEDSLQAYREREKTVDPAEEAKTQVGRLAQLQADRGAMDAERKALSRLLDQLRRNSISPPRDSVQVAGQFIAFPTLLRNQATAELLGALASVENERAALLVKRLPQDPDVQVLDGRIREINSQLKGIAETYLQGLTNQVSTLNDVARGYKSEVRALPAKQVQTARLERDVNVLQEMFVLVQTRLKEAQITESMEDPTVWNADPAVTAERPTSPKPLMNLALSLVLGCFLGMTVSLGQELSDRSVRSRADALLAGGLPVLGAIPRVERKVIRSARRRKGLGRGAPGPVVLTHSGRSAAVPSGGGGAGRGRAAARVSAMLVTRPEAPGVYAESFNQLHANLMLTHREQPLKVLVFTSPLPGEGKTVCAVNFALTLAAAGQKVLLVDADLRCGLVNQVFGCSRQPGFSELLAGKARFEDGAKRIPVGEGGSLVILPSGALQPTPGRVLGMEQVRAAIEGLASRYDFVVIDSPPANVLADAALLGAAADGVVLVVRAGRTRADALRFAMSQLAAARAPVIGTVLNDIDLRRNADDDGSYGYLSEVDKYYVGKR